MSSLVIWARTDVYIAAAAPVPTELLLFLPAMVCAVKGVGVANG